MRFVAFLAGLLAAIASGGVLAWWVATFVMRLVARGLERWRPLQTGPLIACAAVLLLPALLVAAVILVIGCALLWLLRYAPGLVGADQFAIAHLWNVLAAIAACLIVAAGVGAAFREAFGAIGAARRRWSLIELGHPRPEAEARAQYGGPGGRRIVICCDGTSNRPDRQEDGEAAPTNVWKLWHALRCDETQTTWY